MLTGDVGTPHRRIVGGLLACGRLRRPVFAGRSCEALSRAGQTRRIRPLVQAVLRQYPISPVRPARLPAGFNTAFRVQTADGARYVLVRAELAWLAALWQETELAAPAPLPTRDGDLLSVAAHPGVP